VAEESRQSATDGLGLPRRMWWLWPFVVLLIVIWAISLWAVRVADTEATLGVVTSHRGLGNTARAEIALFVPSSIQPRVLGEAVDVTCQGVTLKAQVFSWNKIRGTSDQTQPRRKLSAASGTIKSKR